MRRLIPTWLVGLTLVPSAAACSRADTGDTKRGVDAAESGAAATDPIDAPSGGQQGDELPTLPPLAADAGAATAAFLADHGVSLIALLDVARPFSVVIEPKLSDCDAAIDELGGGPPPDELGAIAGEVPDVVLSGAFIDLIVAIDEYLTRCTLRGGPGEAVERLARAVELVDERLSSL